MLPQASTATAATTMNNKEELNMAALLEKQLLVQREYNNSLIDLFTKFEKIESEMSPPERESSPPIPAEFRNLSEYKRRSKPQVEEDALFVNKSQEDVEFLLGPLPSTIYSEHVQNDKDNDWAL